MIANAAERPTGSSSLFRPRANITPCSGLNALFALLGKRVAPREDAPEQRRGTRKHFAVRDSLARRLYKPS